MSLTAASGWALIASHPDGEDQDEVYMIDDFVIDLIAATPQKPNVNVVKQNE